MMMQIHSSVAAENRNPAGRRVRCRWVAGWLAALVMVLMPAADIQATPPRQQYYEAERCSRELKNDPGKQRYRENWLRCIKQYQDVYRNDPDGSWAAAGLYMTGKTYLDLHHWSGRDADRLEAMDHFERIVLRFPSSAYRKKAAAELARMKADHRPPSAPAPKGAKPETGGLSAEQWYRQGQACRDALKRDTARQRHRVNWEKCIRFFETARDVDANGPWAAASLYQAGLLYQELYRWSGRSADRETAESCFERIRRDFPDSRYYPKAVAKTATDRVAPKAETSPELLEKAHQQYLAAERCYSELNADARKVRYRHNWEKCIRSFSAVHRMDPDGPWAAVAIYMTGQLYRELYRWSSQTRDLHSADAAFRQVVAQYPESEYSPKAQSALGGAAVPAVSAPTAAEAKPSPGETVDSAALQEAVSTPDDPPAGMMTLEETPDRKKEGPTVATGLRFWSNPSYTRIVIDADSETAFEHHLLKKDPSINKPQRLFVDLRDCRLSDDFSKIIPINDDLLINARAGQFDRETVRVVVDIKSFKRYKIFSLNNPFRIVIDMWGTDAPAAPPSVPAVEIPDTREKLAPGALARQLALGVRRIVIDPGHGGRDYGAPGYLKGVHEKQVVLQIGKMLAEMIRKELHCEVIMTRSDDRFLTLEERTAIANTENADLFISIHTNAHHDQRAYGIETYFLNLATDDESIRVAARENATSAKNISDLQTILNDLMQNAKINESSRLAEFVQVSIKDHLIQRGYSRIKNKGVKQAPFYVLLGAQMPAILIETSFISNSRECKRLIDPVYQQRICEAIVQGIRKYIQETNPTAFRNAGEAGAGG
jgi:N-acetylmuramoyl-L-alanine amidase